MKCTVYFVILLQSLFVSAQTDAGDCDRLSIWRDTLAYSTDSYARPQAVVNAWNKLRELGFIEKSSLEIFDSRFSNLRIGYDIIECNDADACFKGSYKYKLIKSYCFEETEDRWPTLEQQERGADPGPKSVKVTTCFPQSDYDARRNAYRRTYRLPDTTTELTLEGYGTSHGLLVSPPRPRIETRWFSLDGITLEKTEWRDDEKCTRSISVSSCVFDRGWLDMDPSGDILWDTLFSKSGKSDSFNRYYAFAIDLNEALSFLLLHEYAHFLGMTTEGTADEYARAMIVEFRKARRNLKYFPRRFPDVAHEISVCDDNNNRTNVFSSNGRPPNPRDLPSGVKLR